MSRDISHDGKGVSADYGGGVCAMGTTLMRRNPTQNERHIV